MAIIMIVHQDEWFVGTNNKKKKLKNCFKNILKHLKQYYIESDP